MRDAVEVQVRIERRAEAVDEGDRAEASRGAGAWTVRAQAGLHGAQEEARRSTMKFGVAFQKMAQPLRHREDPLPQRQVRQDVIGEMRRGLHHARALQAGHTPRPLQEKAIRKSCPHCPHRARAKPRARMPQSR